MPPFKIADNGTIGQMRSLWDIIKEPKSKRSIYNYFTAITVVIGANAVMQVRLNDWQGGIYDAIGHRDVGIFLHQVGVFAVIVSVLLCLGVAQTWLHERLKVRLRQAVTYSLLDEWMKPARAFWLLLKGEISANPDQRIQEDTRRLSELSVDLAVGLVQSSLMLLAFVGVLWQLSEQVVFVIHGKSVMIPGYMVWAAIVYALLGSFATWLVGRPLIAAHTELRAAEAAFRSDLVGLNEAAAGVALSRGEIIERKVLNRPVNAVLKIMRRIANRLAVLNWVTGGYGWFAILAPLLLAAPGYFGGTLSLGGLMMVVGAFYQVQQALRWYVDRFPALAEWRAMLARVISYRSALEELDTIGADGGKIHYVTSPSGVLTLENVSVFAPNGRVGPCDSFVTVAPGERVIFVAAPKSGKSTFIKAIAGLWVWGSGTIYLPPKQDTMFLPPVPHFPAGSLRAVLAYPRPNAFFSDDEAKIALERVRLGRLAVDLNAEQRWDKELALDELRRLNFARLLLHRPLWIIKDESISELDEESKQLSMSIFANELAQTAFVSVGRHDPGDGFYQRAVKLQVRLPGVLLPPRFRKGFRLETEE